MRKLISAFAAVVVLGILNWPSLVAGQAPASATKKIELPQDNSMATLKPGAGVDVVKNDCKICHSTDYIVLQPGGDAKHWEPEVRKMITVYGAPIPASDVQTIVSYLASAYPGEPAKSASMAPLPARNSQHLR